jgi:putative ABC transport system permease protein
MRMLPWDYGVRNLARAPQRTLLTLAGSALVVGLILTSGAFVRGMGHSLTAGADPRNVIVLGAGSEESLERSEIAASTADLISATIPGIASHLNVAHASPEVLLQTVLHDARDGGREMVAVLRGVTPAAFLVHRRVRVIEGRAPRSGHDEMMVGRLAAAKMGVADDRLTVGQTLWFDKRLWTISGRFEAPGTVMDAEVWCPLRDLQIAARRDNLSAVVLTLGDAEFEDIDAFCKQRLDLELVAMREADYFAQLAHFYRPVRILVWVTAVLVSLGGLFGWVNTLYAAFAARVREFGTVQAIGFPRRAVLLTLLQESMLATAAGALAASIVGWWWLDGLAVRFSMGAFGLRVDSTVLLWGLTAALVLAVVATLPPAWRCLRMPITDALRAA